MEFMSVPDVTLSSSAVDWFVLLYVLLYHQSNHCVSSCVLDRHPVWRSRFLPRINNQPLLRQSQV